jgi:NifU-like protein involved in Fe-S cluster formation
VEVEVVIHELRRLLAGEAVEPRWPELAMFVPVSAVRSRHECVLLPLEALQAALTKGRGG